MKILKNNFKKELEPKLENETKKLECEHCNSELEYDAFDVNIGEYGCAFVECPLCGYENYLDDGEHDMDLTMHNVEFPTHFAHVSKDTGAVDACNNEEVRECIRKAIKYFRENKEEFAWITAYGNMVVSVYRWVGDEAYEVIVGNNYYNTYLSFENEDY